MPRPRLVLVHGFLATSRLWGRVARLLASEFDVVAPDLPGHGSARAAGPLSLQRAVDHLAPLLEASAPVVVVGHSMGAIVALALAEAYPERVSHVGLVSVPVYRSRRDALRTLDRRGRFYALTLRHDRLAHAGCLAMHSTRLVWGPFSRDLFHEPDAALVASWFDHTWDAHEAGLSGISFAGHVPVLADGVTQPVAIIHGAHDTAAPHRRAQLLADEHGWPFASLDAGHQIPVTHHRALSEWICTQFLT